MLTLENFSFIFIIQSIQLSTTEQLLDAVYCFPLSDNTEIHWMSIFSVISLEWVIETSDWLGSSRPSTPSAKTENWNQGTGITIMLPKKLLHKFWFCHSHHSHQNEVMKFQNLISQNRTETPTNFHSNEFMVGLYLFILMPTLLFFLTVFYCSFAFYVRKWYPPSAPIPTHPSFRDKKCDCAVKSRVEQQKTYPLLRHPSLFGMVEWQFQLTNLVVNKTQISPCLKKLTFYTDYTCIP